MILSPLPCSALRCLLFLFLGSLSVTMFHIADAHAETVDVWFGTSTPRNGLSKGIYHATFDTEKGLLSQATLAAEADGPGFLALHPNGNVLYSVGNHEGKPSVSAYTIHRDGAQTSLKWHSAAEIGDGGAAHVSVDRTGKVLFTAQYGGGSTAAFRLDADGGIVERTGLYKHVGGSDVVPNRQTSPHAHWTGTSPDNRFLFVPDLGMDQVVIWKVDTESATLTPHGFGQSVPGGGPRHMKFHPNGKIIYLLNELSLSVTVFDYDAEAGTMSPKQTIETLSEAVKAGERFNSSSEIRVHPNGRFVYAANRGNDSITAYRVHEADGTLELIEVESIHGAWPRNFALDPTGKWLLAAGQNTNSVTIFEIDQQTGQLQFTMKAAMVPTPICVLFAE